VSAPRVAARYAEAIFAIARDGDALDDVRSELATLAELVADQPALRRLFERPDLSPEQKRGALREAFGERFSQAIMALIGALVRHRRGEALPQVVAAFEELADQAAGVVRADAETVVPLSDRQRDRLVAALGRLTGKRVVLEERIDPGVVAGVRLRVGDRLIDGSAAGRLARMREDLIIQRGQQR
jgi:ATP synthase F1 delta subunit